MTRTALINALRRPRVLIGAGLIIIIVIVWFLAFFVPQGHKLSTVETEEATIRQTVAQDEAKVRKLVDVSRHLPQIQALSNEMQAYAPATEELYTYIQILSQAAQTSGVKISSISPSALVAASGTAFSEIPITLSISGTYDHVLLFIKTLYALPRLTTINTINFGGGGKTGSRSETLGVTLQTDIYQQAASTSTTTTTTPSTSSSGAS